MLEVHSQDDTVVPSTVRPLQVLQDDGEVSRPKQIRESFHSTSELLVLFGEVWNTVFNVQHVLVFVPPEDSDSLRQRITSSVDTGQQDAVSSRTSDPVLTAH